MEKCLSERDISVIQVQISARRGGHANNLASGEKNNTSREKSSKLPRWENSRCFSEPSSFDFLTVNCGREEPKSNASSLMVSAMRQVLFKFYLNM